MQPGVVRSIILAARAKRANDERYLISGADVVEWTTSYKSLEAQGTNGHVISLAKDELSKHLAEERRNRTILARLRRFAGQTEIRALIRELPLASWSHKLVKRFRPSIRTKDAARASSAGFESIARKPRPLFLPQAGLLELYRSRSRYSTRKASNELGYRPMVNLQHGTQLTVDWAKWFRLL
jgi:hypothetical protein